MMSKIRVEMKEFVACSVSEAFARATDLDHFEDWMPRRGVFKSSRQTSPGPMAVGTTFTDHGRMGTSDGEVLEYAPATRVVYRERLRWFGRQALDVRISYEFRSTPGGTAIRHVAESELHGAFRLMRPMVKLIGPGERRRTLTGLKRSLEAEQEQALEAAA
jgi:uncharacterized protein YndB with AHSA1/START domain